MEKSIDLTLVLVEAWKAIKLERFEKRVAEKH